MRWFALLLVCLLGCNQVQVLHEPDTPGVEACPAFCAVATGLGCSEGGESPEGVACESWCGRYHHQGYMRPFSVCGSKATSVDEIRACGIRCDQ